MSASINLLALFGSPRRGGNTETVLDAVLDGAQSGGARVEKVVLSQLDIRPCNECYSCARVGRCPIDDDMQALYARVRNSNRIVLASPIFFMGFSAQMKLFIDRCQCFWERKYMRCERIPPEMDGVERVGSLIAVGGARNRNLFEGVLLTSKAFFDAVDAKFKGMLLYRAADEKDYMRSRPDLLEQATRFGLELSRPRPCF